MNKTKIMTDQTSLKDMLQIIFKITLPMAFQGVLLSLVQLVDNFFTSFKEQKRTGLAIVAALVAIVINISLNYPHIYSSKMGIKGSALTTMTAIIFQMIVWISYVVWKKLEFVPRIKDFRNMKLQELFIILPKSFWWMLNGFLASLALTLQIMFMSRISIKAGEELNIASIMAQLVYAFLMIFLYPDYSYHIGAQSQIMKPIIEDRIQRRKVEKTWQK